MCVNCNECKWDNYILFNDDSLSFFLMTYLITHYFLKLIWISENTFLNDYICSRNMLPSLLFLATRQWPHTTPLVKFWRYTASKPIYSWGPEIHLVPFFVQILIAFRVIFLLLNQRYKLSERWFKFKNYI